MSRSKLLTIAVLGLLLINLGTLIFIFTSRERPDGRPPRGEGPKRIIIQRLGFDEQQQDLYEVLVQEHRESSRELNQKARVLHQELFSLLKEKEYKAKADSLINEIALNQKRIDSLNMDHFEKIKGLCRNEQIEKFNKLAEDLAHLFVPPGPPH